MSILCCNISFIVSVNLLFIIINKNRYNLLYILLIVTLDICSTFEIFIFVIFIKYTCSY